MSLATRTILQTLSLERLRTLARDFDAEHLWPMTKVAALDNLEKCPGVSVPKLLDMLLFEELGKACRVLGLDDRAYRREVLVQRLLQADGSPGPDPTPAPSDMKKNGAAPPAPILEPVAANQAEPARRVHRASRPAAPRAPQG
jgi:hypothetical protein